MYTHVCVCMFTLETMQISERTTVITREELCSSLTCNNTLTSAQRHIWHSQFNASVWAAAAAAPHTLWTLVLLPQRRRPPTTGRHQSVRGTARTKTSGAEICWHSVSVWMPASVVVSRGFIFILLEREAGKTCLLQCLRAWTESDELHMLLSQISTSRCFPERMRLNWQLLKNTTHAHAFAPVVNSSKKQWSDRNVIYWERFYKLTRDNRTVSFHTFQTFQIFKCFRYYLGKGFIQHLEITQS